MGEAAAILLWALLSLCKVTQIGTYRISHSSLVLNRVEKLTVLVIVLILYWTLLSFEIFKNQVPDALIGGLIIDFEDLILLSLNKSIILRRIALSLI